ncbi:MAG: QueT transporter family protein [Candidatus Bathyarchaeota archaeon]|nr:MAG: QueT transporter family protein [Candidatus Bathyarchaeota archaeon]
MRLGAVWVSVAAVFAALYAVGVIFLAPISFSVYQVRLADALPPLSMIFGIPSVIGLSLGCVVSNVYGGLGLIDIVGGATANFIASALAWYIARRRGITHRFLGATIETLVVTLIVGGYLWIILEVPLELGLFGVLVGSIVAINIVGFPIQEVIRRSAAIKEIATRW